MAKWKGGFCHFDRSERSTEVEKSPMSLCRHRFSKRLGTSFLVRVWNSTQQSTGTSDSETRDLRERTLRVEIMIAIEWFQGLRGPVFITCKRVEEADISM